MTHTPKPPFYAASGPAHPKIVILGEAWGESEERTHKPFAGQSGLELFRMLGEAMLDVEPELHLRVLDLADKYGDAWVADRGQWLEAAGISMTNVLAFRPPGNKIDSLCVNKKEAGAYAGSFHPLQRGLYLKEEYLGELDRLKSELSAWAPNLVVCMGNTACWALLHATNIGSIRGAVTETVIEPRIKALPTYHPAGVLRSWAWRPIVVADLMKAAKQSAYPEIRRPQRRVLVSPTLDEMLDWESDTYKRGCFDLAIDIETEAKQITMVGFARSQTEAMVIPFWDRTKPGYSYWPDHQSERKAWDCVERLCQCPARKILQNGIYDTQYLTKYGIRPTNMTADTMLLHHSLFPEMQKGLAFLGSVYTDEISWKLWRKRKADSVKADE